VKRLTVAELEAFREAAPSILHKVRVTPEELHGLFAGVVDGPVGSLDINETEVVDLPGLLAFAALECPMLDGSLADELFAAVTAINSLSADAAGN
jgi:hypothetical protein